MKLNKFFLAGALASSLVLVTSCVEDYKIENQDPANVTETKPEGLLTSAINAFNPVGYLVWWNNVVYFTQWSQLAGGAYEDSFTTMDIAGDQGSTFLNTMKYRNRIKQYLDSYSNGENSMRGYEAATSILTVYLGIFDSDVYGSIPYQESCHYDDLGILTPKYDDVETLYNLWIEELNAAIGYLRMDNLDKNARQDAAYGCDWSKWAKLANSLKLKIAVRLYNNNPSKALEIAKEAVNNAAGLITDTEDDFLFCKATTVNTGDMDYEYGTGNGLRSIVSSNNVIDFMLKSKDPRVRFVYTKNGFNSKVVESFIQNGKYDDLPTQVKENVILKETADGKKTFDKWGGMGEPWVRYTSQPICYSPSYSLDKGLITEEFYTEYFKPGLRYQVHMKDGAGEEKVKEYNPFSYYTTEMRKGRDGYQLPTAMTLESDGSIDMHIIQDTDPHPLYVMYMGAGEVNLYLAELALINGGTLDKYNAEQCYYAGVRASVEELDYLASANKIPYYGTTYNYDENEKPIDLVAGEIDAMLATDNVKFVGSTDEKLEKVYLQLLMHFSHQPDDQFVTARRSGYPKFGSKLLPRVDFQRIVPSGIPRRFLVNEPLVTDLMAANQKEAYAAQGYTKFGSDCVGVKYNEGNAPLNVERVWQDKSAPQWGTPK